MQTKSIKESIEKRHLPIIFCFLFCFLSVNIGFGFQANQDKERTIKRTRYSNEPVTVELKVKGKDRKDGEPFTEDGDWIKGLSMKIRNNQPKPIVYIVVNLILPETGESSGQPPIGRQIKIGRRPESSETTGNSILLIQNDTLTYSLPEQEYANLTRRVESRGFNIANLKKATFHIFLVIFSDSSSWACGDYFNK